MRGIVLAQILRTGPLHVARSAVVNSRNNVCCGFVARKLMAESNVVTPVELVFSVSMGTWVFTIWYRLKAASVDEMMTSRWMYMCVLEYVYRATGWE